jgi:hypothetical protein
LFDIHLLARLRAMEWDYEATYLSNKSRKGMPTGNADVGPMGRFLKQMGGTNAGK